MNIDFPTAAEVLFNEEPRFIVLWGGRGSGKSWSIARALLIRAASTKLRILCCRELQNSIAESVHKLLSTQIDDLGLTDFYEIQNTTIIGKNGSEFIFAGLKNNATKIKSYEGVDIAFCEEAQAITKASWEILTPTIRKPGSQIICSFNPVLAEDFIYKRFVIDPPSNAVVVKMNYTENPWFGEPLLTEMKEMASRDPDGHSNVWLGNPRQTLDGAIYAEQMRSAQNDGRITRVPYDHSKPVSAFFDLGHSDHTSIWIAQVIGFEFRIIDFVQDRQKTITHYLKALQDKPYTYDTLWLPHDGQSQQLAAGGRSIEMQMKALGHKVRIVPKLSVADGINAARTIFPNCFFDAERCSDGLQSLRHYRYEVDPDTGQFSDKPLHDGFSDGADAFRYLAVALKEPKRADGPKKPAPKVFSQPGAWMR